jgi:hypothetical protein
MGKLVESYYLGSTGILPAKLRDIYLYFPLTLYPLIFLVVYVLGGFDDLD